MKKSLLVLLLIISCFLCSCSGEIEAPETSAPELTLGELPDYSDAHAEDAPYLVFSSDLEPISSERIEKVRNAFYQLLYWNEYRIQTEILKDTGLEENKLFEKAHNSAVQYAEGYKSTLMNPENLIYEDAYSYVCRFTSRYYGTINGCEIISFHSFVEKDNVLELGGVKIEDAHPFYIFACKEKEFITLTEAYQKEWLEASDILLIAKRNRDYNSYWEENCSVMKVEYDYVKYADDLEELSKEMIDEIKDMKYAESYASAYTSSLNYLRETYGELYGDEKIENIAISNAARGAWFAKDDFMKYANTHRIGWRYYGIIGGYAVFAEVHPSDNGKVYRFGDHMISFSNGAEMFVYSSDVGMLELGDAYNRGLLTDADIAKMSERHILYQEYIKNK